MNNLQSPCLLAYLIFNLLLAGCFGGKAPALRSETGQRAETALTRAVRAEHKGNIPEAENLLTEALTFSTSIEDIPLRATVLINLARLHRLQHNQPKAEQFITEALGLLTAQSPLFSEAADEKALLELAQGHHSAALDWAGQSIASEQGNLLGSRRNLASRIQLELGNWSTADQLARAALKENRAAEQAEEEANSLRILGIVARNEKKHEEAGRFLQEALSIDKRNGISSKIAADLEELATTSQSGGQLEEAAHFLERASDVNLSAGRFQRAILNQETLADIYSVLGNRIKADMAGQTAHKLANRAGSQQPNKPSATTKPSSKP